MRAVGRKDEAREEKDGHFTRIERFAEKRFRLAGGDPFASIESI